MLFNTFHFFVFFVAVCSIYFFLPHKHRWWWLLLSSCYFYMVYVPIYILILGSTIFIDYYAGVFIEKNQGTKRKRLLILSLLVNIGVLFTFKYFNFVNQNLILVLQSFGIKNPIPFLNIALPVGLSFHTFQAMSYTIEIYRGNQKAEQHFGIYALYVMFFPQLVAGPIERPQNLLHQFREKFHFDDVRVISGLKLMAWGLFKKVVIADRLAIGVDAVYKHPELFNSFTLILATIFFSFQLFCDFSGYSDMAIGAARVLGFRLMKNFDNPFQSDNIQQFWKRWHISLSGWFRDYLYLPLGGSHVAVPRWYLNLIIVFLVSGLWHGAGWTFLIWGGLHGIYMLTYFSIKPIRNYCSNKLGKKTWKVLSVILTFNLVNFAFIFFRAKNLHEAWFIISRIITELWKDVVHLSFNKWPIDNIGLTKFNLLLCLFLILLLETVHYVQSRVNINHYLYQKPAALRWALYCLLSIGILYFGVFENKEFVYFQF